MKLTKETLKQIIKEELQNAIEESEFKSAPFAAKVHHEKHKTDISPLVDKYQTDHDYSAPHILMISWLLHHNLHESRQLQSQNCSLLK